MTVIPFPSPPIDTTRPHRIAVDTARINAMYHDAKHYMNDDRDSLVVNPALVSFFISLYTEQRLSQQLIMVYGFLRDSTQASRIPAEVRDSLLGLYSLILFGRSLSTGIS